MSVQRAAQQRYAVKDHARRWTLGLPVVAVEGEPEGKQSPLCAKGCVATLNKVVLRSSIAFLYLADLVTTAEDKLAERGLGEPAVLSQSPKASAEQVQRR